MSLTYHVGRHSNDGPVDLAASVPLESDVIGWCSDAHARAHDIVCVMHTHDVVRMTLCAGAQAARPAGWARLSSLVVPVRVGT